MRKLVSLALRDSARAARFLSMRVWVRRVQKGITGITRRDDWSC